MKSFKTITSALTNRTKSTAVYLGPKSNWSSEKGKQIHSEEPDFSSIRECISYYLNHDHSKYGKIRLLVINNRQESIYLGTQDVPDDIIERDTIIRNCSEWHDVIILD